MIDLQKQKNKNMLQNNITVIPEIKIINEQKQNVREFRNTGGGTLYQKQMGTLYPKQTNNNFNEKGVLRNTTHSLSINIEKLN